MLVMQVFLNYGSTAKYALPIPASLVPSRTTSAANVNSTNAPYGQVNMLAGVNGSFALRFSGARSWAGRCKRSLPGACAAECVGQRPHMASHSSALKMVQGQDLGFRVCPAEPVRAKTNTPVLHARC